MATFERSEHLCEMGVDVVGVAAVNRERGRIVIDALSRGVHVLADKPLLLSLDELNAVRRLREERRLEPKGSKIHGDTHLFVQGTTGAIEVKTNGELGVGAVILTTADKPPHEVDLPKISHTAIYEEVLAVVRGDMARPALLSDDALASTALALRGQAKADEASQRRRK